MKKLLLTIALLVLQITTSFALNNTKAQYTVVVDGGSSGSRIYLYQYTPSKDKNAIKLIASKKITPGLSNFTNNTKQIGPYFKPLLTFIKQKLAQRRIAESEVNFYFLATAGMRMFPRYQQDTVYTELKDTVQKQTKFHIKQITTITGQWEAIYNWLAANYSYGTLQSGKTLGVLDMGGASTEIAFELHGDIPKQEVTYLRINSTTFPLYAVSYLGIGQNVIRSQYLNNANCFPVGYTMPNGNYGVGDYDKCIKDIKPLIDHVQNVAKTKKLVPDNMDFIAVDVFYKLTHSTVVDLPKGFTPRILHSIGSKFCRQNWQNLRQQYGNDPGLYKDCFNMAYFYTLLKSGYHFKEHQFFHTTHDIDWTLGVAVYQAFGPI